MINFGVMVRLGEGGSCRSRAALPILGPSQSGFRALADFGLGKCRIPSGFNHLETQGDFYVPPFFPKCGQRSFNCHSGKTAHRNPCFRTHSFQLTLGFRVEADRDW